MATFPVIYHNGTMEQTPYIEELTPALDPVLRTEAEAGYVRTRPRFTRAPRKWQLRYDMVETANKNTIRAFEVAQAGEAFRWADPAHVDVNMLVNPGFETGNMTGWTQWNTPSTSEIAGAPYPYAGSYCLHHFGDGGDLNAGRRQAVPCLPSTLYTFSAYISQQTGSTSVRVMAFDGTSYINAYPVGIGAYEAVGSTITTAAAATSLTIYLGGVGNAWFDDVSLTTTYINARIGGPVVYVPANNTANTRWTISLILEEV